MKFLYSFLAALFVGTAAALSQAEVGVSVDFFHDNLQAYGDWREVGDLGYCWQPRDVERGWRPYRDGRWVYTDAGWTWDSAEPYSWAVFHYGRWARVDQVGWVWVPGTEWGPAWVSWRSDATQVGWAPLSPDAVFDRSVGFDSGVDAQYDLGPTNYNFVEVRNFGAPDLRVVLIDPQENFAIYSQSTNITRITYVNNVVYNGGPQYDVISGQSAQPIPRLKLEMQAGVGGNSGAVHAEQLQTKVVGGSLRVAAIPFNSNPATAPHKVAAKVGNAALDHGWNNAGPPAAVAKLRAQVKSDAAAHQGAPTAQAPTGATPPNGSVPKKKSTGGERSNIPAAPVARDANTPVKPGNTEAGSPRSAPPVNEETVPKSQAKKGRDKGNETLHPAVGTVPGGVENERAPKAEHAERAPNEPPAAVETPRSKIRPGKGDEPPKPEQPAIRETEHNVPNVPEPHPQTKKPEAHEPAAPTANQPQPAKGKTRDKGKDDKKDAPKPEGAPQ